MYPNKLALIAQIQVVGFTPPRFTHHQQEIPCEGTKITDRRTKAEHLSVVSSTNLGVKYSPRAEIQSRQRVNLEVFVELAFGRSGVGSFLVENPTCGDFTTAQPIVIKHLLPRYEPQTGYNLSDIRITTTDTFKILTSFSGKSFPAKLISRPSPQSSHHLPKQFQTFKTQNSIKEARESPAVRNCLSL